ncbi:MAG: hypothetical protein R3A48_20260 [Polyangiales bacterium]
MSTRRPRRLRPELLALCAVVSCASQAPSRGRALTPLPDGELASPWLQRRVDAATEELFLALSRNGLSALRRRRIRVDDDGVLSDAGRGRAERSISGLRPREGERRWSVLRRLAGDRVVGWCARGLSVHEANDALGFAQRALTVDRLLVVVEGARGRWGLWVEGLVLDGAAWRWLPWVPWSDAVETPRSAHTDIEMWSCELERRPAQLAAPQGDRATEPAGPPRREGAEPPGSSAGATGSGSPAR